MPLRRSQATELVAVTASLDTGLADALLDRAFARKPTSLILVEAASFRPGGAPPLRDPALLRLQAGGIPVAVLRQGDDLAAKLSGFEEVASASG